MIVCVCHVVNEQAIRELRDEYDCKTIDDLRYFVQVCETCQRCQDAVNDILGESREQKN